jgi:hypothetical protein
LGKDEVSKSNSVVDLVRRGEYLDVFIDGVHRGSGSWIAVYTAQWFYHLEGMSVRVKDE